MGNMDHKAILNNKKAFRVGSKEEVRKIQGDLKVKLRRAKDKYRRKLDSLEAAAIIIISTCAMYIIYTAY